MSDRQRSSTVEERYLDLMKLCLTRLIFADEDYNQVNLHRAGWQGPPARLVDAVMRRLRLRLVHAEPPNVESRRSGRDRPQHGETMIGMARLDNIQHCVEDVLDRNVPGDLIETGVWRGGAAIFMRAILAARRDTERRVWLADSFSGLPPPDAEKYPADQGIDLWKQSALAVDLETVKANFRRYDLLDDRVEFLVGWFSETLPEAPISQLAVMRLDGDLYESTMDALSALYPRLSPGGYVIVDDYGTIPACRQAVHDYRDAQRITDEIRDIDGWGAFWQRTR